MAVGLSVEKFYLGSCTTIDGGTERVDKPPTKVDEGGDVGMGGDWNELYAKKEKEEEERASDCLHKIRFLKLGLLEKGKIVREMNVRILSY